MELSKGKLIVLEGIDGSGKTVVGDYLLEELTKLGVNCVKFREPSDSKYADEIKKLSRKEIRDNPYHEFNLFLKDRMYDVRTNILPALNEGKVVIMDRYYFSSYAYQGTMGLSKNMILIENEKFAPKPDLVILLDVSIEKSLERIKNRNLDLSNFEEIEYLKKAKENYYELESMYKSIFVRINSDKELSEVKTEVMNCVKKFLNID